ncbi:diguanylate cyclase [Fluviicoccus keumensis]|uniref:diguanylate cyclase n=1 Tax=Fluviicoccus keumensis TaxID=1435465 RepID=A0A4Q7YMQ6_9GAMM|nr:diguanylate cyclase [Fluviicoccus keumensis]RZU38660.1 diguanylate cyclase [Fluviicoccus keumensis]
MLKTSRLLHTRHRALRLLMLALCCACVCHAALAGTLVVDPAAPRLTPGHHLDYLADPGRSLSPSEVGRRTDWQPVRGETANFGYSHSALWLRAKLLNPSPHPQNRLLEIGYPVLDKLQIWAQPSAGPSQAWLLGDKLPFATRPILHRHFLVPLTLPANGSVDLLIRVETGSSVQVPVNLWQPDAFRQHDEQTGLILGMYFGIMLSMLLYNSFLCFSLRERQYAWYVGYVAAITVFLASLDGLSFQYLWPNATIWNDRVIVFSLALTLFFGALFAGSFLHIERAGRGIRLAMRLTLAGSLASAAAAFLTHYTISIHLVEGCAIVCIPVIFSFAVYRAWQGYKPARFYIAAWSFVLFSGIVLALDKYGLIAHSALTVVAVPIGSSMQILLLSFALADRVQQERRRREDARIDMLRMQQEANTALELRVQARTVELMEANIRLQELTITDALTGAHNRRHFDEVLRQEVKRALRSGDHLGLLIIDADHFKRINDTWGHPTGDACLQAIARVLQGEIHRECDTVARFGGEEFCLVLPSTDGDGVAHVAEKLRATLEQTLIPGPQGPIRITVSIGAVSVVPEDTDDDVRMLATADAALYLAKQDGRNRVSVRRSLD